MGSLKISSSKSSDLRKSNEAFHPTIFPSLGMCETIAKMFKYLLQNDSCAILIQLNY